jgi:hypothetical protein
MPGQIVFVVARDPSRRRALGRALAGAPELQAVTMSGAASIASLARSARPAAIVVEAGDAPLLAGLSEQVEIGAIPLVTLTSGASPASAVAAVRAAVAAAPLA